MPRHPTITLKTKPKIFVMKGRSKGPTVVLTKKPQPIRAVSAWQFTIQQDGSLSLEYSNPFESAGTEFLLLKAMDMGQALNQCVSAVVNSPGWKIGGGDYSLQDQLKIAFQSIGLIPETTFKTAPRVAYYGSGTKGSAPFSDGFKLILHRGIRKGRLGYHVGHHILGGIGFKRLGFVFRSVFPEHRKMPWRILGGGKSFFRTRSTAVAWLNS